MTRTHGPQVGRKPLRAMGSQERVDGMFPQKLSTQEDTMDVETAERRYREAREQFVRNETRRSRRAMEEARAALERARTEATTTTEDTDGDV